MSVRGAAWLLTMTSCIVLFSGLGIWQLLRAEEKAELLAGEEDSFAREPVEALRNLTMADALQPVRLQGHFRNRYSVFLDNRTRDGKAGFELVVPFTDSASQRTVLVNRGWFAFAGDRQRIPVPPGQEGEVRIEAEIYGSPRPLLGSLAESLAVAGSKTPLVPYLQADIIGRHFGLDLEPVLLRLRDGSPAALRLDWPTIGQMGPERHRGYAVQWFALALAFALMTLFARRSRRATDE